jgi:phosphoenolpyruvate carboxykinase (ATP)
MVDLSYIGLSNLNSVHRNRTTPVLYEEAVRRREGSVAHLGPLVVRTGQYTGRSAKDKYIVAEAPVEDKVWWGAYTQRIEHDTFAALKLRLAAYLQGRDVFVQDCYAGAASEHRLKLRVVTELAWHSLFARNLFVREFDKDKLADFAPDFTVLDCPGFHAIPELDGTRSEAFIIICFSERLVVIGGTEYAGEIKKSVFTVMNYLLPQKDVMPVHAAANVGADGRSALFFGLSGTGKTTLSTDPDRKLLGDDEHGWAGDALFNFEGGCYAKMIRLDPASEPEIFQTTRRFGTILENVIYDSKTRRLDLDDGTLTENTRGAYPIDYVPNVVSEGTAAPPSTVVMLTADAFGVLPPIAKLTPAQAMYHLISGYTAKVAGTERGVTEPTATFSELFGAPFMALHPTVYAEMFGKRVEEHGASCWLVNTGWSGGGHGVGARIAIASSRALIRAAISGQLDDVEYRTDPVFGLRMPVHCPDVPDEILDPRQTWADKEAYDQAAKDLARRFAVHFEAYESSVTSAVVAAGPVVPA